MCVCNCESECRESIDSSLILLEDGGATVLESTLLGRETVSPGCAHTHTHTHSPTHAQSQEQMHMRVHTHARTYAHFSNCSLMCQYKRNKNETSE